MSVKHFTDLYNQLEKVTANNGITTEEVLETADFGAGMKSAGHALEISFPDAGKRNKYLNEIIVPYINTKLVRTQDFTTMRTPTVSTVMEERRNEYTPWLNFLESQPGGAEIAEDFEYKFLVYDIGLDEAEVFDHQSSLPSEVKSSYPSDSNTVGCVGVKILMADLAMNMLNRTKNINILNREIGAAVTRIRRKMESMLLSNTEVTLEGPVPIPQPGGFLTRSDVAPIDLGGDDFTRPTLQGAIKDIADIASQNGRGYRQLALLTNEQQVQVVRDIIVNENNGIFPTDRVAFESWLMKQMSDVKVNVRTVFENLFGPAVPTVLVPSLPANTDRKSVV